MSTQIDVSLVNQFSANVYMLASQKGSRLRPAVRLERVQGEFAFFEQIGNVEAVQRTSRHADTPFTEVPHSRRRLGTDDWELSEIVDAQDLNRMLMNPQSAYAVRFAESLGRRMDRTLITAMGGSASSGKAGGTAVALPSGQKIDVDYVETGSPVATALTVGKLRRAAAIFDEAEAGTDPLTKRYIVMSPHQRQSLLRTTELTSADFNTVRALVNGEINTFMGFEFILLSSGFFPTIASNTAGIYAFVSDGVILGEGEGITTNAAPDPTKGFNIRLHSRASFGAVRMEEVKVVEIACRTNIFSA